MPNPLKAIHASFNLLTCALDHDQVPNDIRRSLELVRTCDSDLQHLIELRQECLHLLQRRPRVLERVHNIIESARRGLQEVCEIVERCRPETDRGGKTTFSKCMAWVLVDASEFKSQEPIVSRHHAAVLAELNFLRQIALLAPVPETVRAEDKCGVREEAAVFDNVALLGDLLGDVTAHTKKPPVVQPIDPPNTTTIFNTNAESTTSTTTPSSLQVPQSLHRSTSSQTMHMEHAPESLPELVPVNMNSTALPKPLTSSATYDSEALAGLSLLLGDPLDWRHSPPLAPANNGPLNRPVTPPSQRRPANFIHNGSVQNLPLHSYDSVSDLSQTSQRASLNYTPSCLSSNISSPYHQQHSLSIPPAATRSASHLHHMPSGHYPGQLTWSNSSCTTISSISSGLTRPDYSCIPPIAELDSSPHHMVPILGALNHLSRPNEVSVDQKLAIQINTTPVELPAEDSLPTNTNPYSQTFRPGLDRRGRAISQPATKLHQQITRKPTLNQGKEMMKDYNDAPKDCATW